MNLIIYSFSLEIVHVRGKRGRQVPVLCGKEEISCIELLIKTREKVGVNPNNVFVFAAPTRSSLKPLRGNDCSRKIFGKIENLESPERLQSKELRKYCATVVQIADLTETDLEWLSRHLGHDLTVHKEFYRLSESTVELTKVSRLLLALDEGKKLGSNIAGKKLSEIKIDGKIFFF